MKPERIGGMPEAARSRTRGMAYIALFVALLAICAWISIPLAVPFTMQTAAVFLAAGLLGRRRGAAAVLVYLLVGAVGLPVFAGFRGGAGVLLGATGGYAVGFLPAAYLAGAVMDRWGRTAAVMAVAMVGGLFVCYALGTAWFMYVYLRATGPIGLTSALSMCVLPYIVPDMLKIALAMWLTCRLARQMRL